MRLSETSVYIFWLQFLYCYKIFCDLFDIFSRKFWSMGHMNLLLLDENIPVFILIFICSFLREFDSRRLLRATARIRL